MPSFPLFNLPSLAVESFLCTLDMNELLELSKTSNRSKNRIRFLMKTKLDVYVAIRLCRNPYIWLSSEKKTWSFTYTSDESRTRYEPKTNSNMVFVSIQYSEDPVTDWMGKFDELRGVLGDRLDSINIELHEYPEKNKLIIEWLRPLKIDKMGIESSMEVCDDVDKIQLLFVQSEMYYGRMTYGEHFKFMPPTSSYRLTILDSSCIDLKQLSSFENRWISLYNSDLMPRDINGFLMSWIECNHHLNLAKFDVNVGGSETIRYVLRNIPNTITENESRIEKIKKSFPWQIRSVYDITRCDGKIATVGSGYSDSAFRLFMIVF
uniref:F-box domain-containing protein n=1 Tax=Caenorhabditis tropicalis TaxID=1561998 RepID=A0A1I7UHY8_9PELO